MGGHEEQHSPLVAKLIRLHARGPSNAGSVGLKHLPFFILLMFALVVGLLTVDDFGQSWDEANKYRYADFALQDNRFLRRPSELAEYEPHRMIASAFYIVTGATARLLTTIIPSWTRATAWHAVYFVTFLIGVTSLYLLATRWMSTGSALAAALLYLSQPIFWGHAFINPKDIPLMALFIASVYAGFRMPDGLRGPLWIDWKVIPAALLLGVTSSLRVAGPLAGLIVLASAVLRLRSKAIALAIAYVALAAATTYLFWPYLWGEPLYRYWHTVGVMEHFDWNYGVLFAGQVYLAYDLPASYVPTLLAIQLTEPALLLCSAGLLVSVQEFVRRRVQAPLMLVVVWCLCPLSLIVGIHSTLYDNARQTYFLLPPLFLAAGLVFERLFARWRSTAIRALIVLLAVLPGTAAAVRLHPYEYVYYNSLAGGTAGAYGRFEMDYWATSMKEVTEYLNSIDAAPINVGVYSPIAGLMSPYVRPGVSIYGPSGNAEHYDYLVILIRASQDEHYCDVAPVVHTVGRDGSLFSIIRRTINGVACN